MKKDISESEYKNIFDILLSLKVNADKALKNEFLKPALNIVLLQLQKDIKAVSSFYRHYRKYYELPKKLKKKIDLTRKLQVGGGKRYFDDFVNLDLFPPADIIWDCRYGLPFPKETFDFVFSEHFLEHLDFPISVKLVVSEIYRVLRQGGELFIGVPDAGKVIKAYSSSNNKFLNNLREKSYSHRRPPVELYGNIDLVNYVFRDQLDNPDYTIHYWAYDEESLKNLLTSVGFREVKRARFNSKYCNLKRKFYTLFVKAKK